MRRQWLGIAIGMLALFLALDGPALAGDAARAGGKLITGKQVKNGSLQAKDLSKAARKSLAGKRGPQGVPGPIEGVAAGGDLTGTYPAPEIAPDSVGIPEIGVAPAVRVYGSGTSVPTGTPTGGTTLNWGSGVTYQTVGSMYDVAEGTRLVAPVTGLYLAQVSIGFSPNSTGIRTVGISINGVTSNPACFDRDQASSGGAAFVNATCPVRLSAGQFVTTTVTQTSGGTLSLSGFESASLTWLGSLS